MDAFEVRTAHESPRWQRRTRRARTTLWLRGYIASCRNARRPSEPAERRAEDGSPTFSECCGYLEFYEALIADLSYDFDRQSENPAAAAYVKVTSGHRWPLSLVELVYGLRCKFPDGWTAGGAQPKMD
jgi:hypothetical protein